MERELTPLYYHYDDEGYFTETTEVREGEEAPENATTDVWEEPCTRPRFVDGKWIDAEKPEVDEDFLELIRQMEEEERLLRGGN